MANPKLWDEIKELITLSQEYRTRSYKFSNQGQEVLADSDSNNKSLLPESKPKQGPKIVHHDSPLAKRRHSYDESGPSSASQSSSSQHEESSIPKKTI